MSRELASTFDCLTFILYTNVLQPGYNLSSHFESTICPILDVNPSHLCPPLRFVLVIVSSPSVQVSTRLSGLLFQCPYFTSFLLLMKHRTSSLTPSLSKTHMFDFLCIHLILSILRHTNISRFNKICHPSQRLRWQVDKEAIGLSRVQQCSSTYNPPS